MSAIAKNVVSAESRLQNPGFQRVSDLEISARAMLEDGFVVRQDYEDSINYYLRKATVFWPLLTNKEPADSNIVQEITDGPEPETGFMNKNSLQPQENPSDLPAGDLSDTGQEVKAAGGLIQFSHYARSLYRQQGRPYGDLATRKTNDLIASTAKTIERGFFRGNATTNPLEFNGLGQQMHEGQSFVADKRDGDVAYKKLRSIGRMSVDDEDVLGGITHIFTSALGVEVLEEEMDAKLQYTNLEEIRPGLKVPSLITQGDSQGAPTPIITSPYIRDEDNGADADVINYWLVDMNTLYWKGVYPDGGIQSFDPQIFEVSYYSETGNDYLIDKRMCLIYGTLKANKHGRGIWKLSLRVQSGTVGSI